MVVRRRATSTVVRGDTVAVEPGVDRDRLNLRIGPRRQGRTRYAVLTRRHALRIALNLIRCAEELPD